MVLDGNTALMRVMDECKSIKEVANYFEIKMLVVLDFVQNWPHFVKNNTLYLTEQCCSIITVLRIRGHLNQAKYNTRYFYLFQ